MQSPKYSRKQMRLVFYLTLCAWCTTAPCLGAAAPSLPWQKNYEVARAEARRLQKPLVVYFHTARCPWCKRMARQTLRAERLGQVVDKYVWARVDIDRQLTLARKRGVEAAPDVQILLPDGRIAARCIGYVPPEDLRQFLHTNRRYVARVVNGEAELAAQEHRRETEQRGDIVFVPGGFRGRSICFSHVGYGPLHLSPQSPLVSLRLGLHPHPPSTLAEGEWALHWTETWVNLWSEASGSYRIDAESLHSSLALDYGLADTLRLSLAFDTRARFGGEMDAFIQGFHDLFGIGQNGRLELPRDDFNSFFDVDGGEVRLTDDDRGTFLTSLTLTMQHNITCGTDYLPALSCAASIRRDLVQDDIRGGDNWDGGLSVSAARRFGNVYGYLSLGYAYFGEETFRGIPLQRDQWRILTAGEWHFHERQALVAQYMASEGVAVDAGDFSQWSHEVTLGWKYEPRPGTVLELGLIENIIVYDNSPDFGVHFGLLQRF
jgi:hypothetical protein